MYNVHVYCFTYINAVRLSIGIKIKTEVKRKTGHNNKKEGAGISILLALARGSRSTQDSCISAFPKYF